MANHIDYTYFRKPFYEIPGVCSVTDDLAIREILEIAITDYETEVLKLFLGYDVSDADNFYNLYIAGKDSETRFIALKNLIVDSTNKRSAITGYVYFKFWKFNLSGASKHGFVRNQISGGEYVEDWGKICSTWNKSVQMWEDIHDWLIENSSTYPEYENTALPDELGYINVFGI
jgi:hypothetical protein